MAHNCDTVVYTIGNHEAMVEMKCRLGRGGTQSLFVVTRTEGGQRLDSPGHIEQGRIGVDVHREFEAAVPHGGHGDTWGNASPREVRAERVAKGVKIGTAQLKGSHVAQAIGYHLGERITPLQVLSMHHPHGGGRPISESCLVRRWATSFLR